METFAQTKKRKAEDDITPKRSTKRSGSETIAYLRERAEQDHVTELEELEIKRKDQQALENSIKEQSAQQKLMMNTFKNQVASQAQQTQQLIQIQQQQQQDLMSLIEKMMKKDRFTKILTDMLVLLFCYFVLFTEADTFIKMNNLMFHRVV